MLADWIDAELRNWGRWCWSGTWPHPLPADHCYSIEHRYVGPHLEGAEVEQEEVARRIPVIRERAEIVHRVYRDQLSRLEQQVLVFEYVHLAHLDGDEWIENRDTRRRRKARKLRVSLRVYEQALIDAGRRVREALPDRGVLTTN